jgi:cold shock protein
MSRGTVKWFNASYGFISRADGPDVFVHYSEIDGYGFRSLEENQQAEFEVTQGPKGPQATRVRRLSQGRPSLLECSNQSAVGRSTWWCRPAPYPSQR